MDNIDNIQINLMNLIEHVENANSGHDRDTVFAYIEDFLKEEHQIEVDIYKILDIDY
jgi:hypothetical protein